MTRRCVDLGTPHLTALVLFLAVLASPIQQFLGHSSIGPVKLPPCATAHKLNRSGLKAASEFVFNVDSVDVDAFRLNDEKVADAKVKDELALVSLGEYLPYELHASSHPAAIREAVSVAVTNSSRPLRC